MDDTQKKEAGLKTVELAKKMGASDETLKRLADEIGCGESESTTVAVKIESKDGMDSKDGAPAPDKMKESPMDAVKKLMAY